ncbi:type I-E CRISPR-associated protein Cas5/CasD [Amycolatopsis lurida]
MSTLVARLAGPLQSWGAEPKLRVASTHPTPTRSGLLGLARAALGHGRDAPLSDITWVTSLDMAIRVDQPGTIHADFHTISPLPQAYQDFALVGPHDRGQIPQGTRLRASGQAARWDKGQPTMITRRHLIHDAAFLWLIHGPDAHLHRLATALLNPQWTLSLGRKSCTPASPVLLGLHPGSLPHTANTVPVARTPHRALDTATKMPDQVTVELIWTHGTPATSTTTIRTVLDNPLGSHPQHGYATNTHHHTHVTAPTTPDLLTWASTHLTRPTPEDTP